MSVGRQERQERNVECHACKRTFPVAAITSAEEAQQAVDGLKAGKSLLRVARWCPWCGKTNMVELTVGFVENEIVFRDADKTLAGHPPKTEERP